MHLIQTHEGPKAKTIAIDGPPFGPGFKAEVVDKATKIEVWGSDFTDQGSDFCEYRAFDASGALIGTRRVSGY